MDSNRVFYLYHGTIRCFANTIITNRKFTFQKRSNHWLGNGVYFFVDDKVQASIWAGLCRKKNSKNESLCEKELNESVFELKYSVDKAKYLNLDSREDIINLNEFIKELENEKAEIVLPPKSDKHAYLCSIMDIYVAYYDIVASKYTFSNGGKLQEKLEPLGLESHGEQFCIYKPETIDFSKVRLVEEEVS